VTLYSDTVPHYPNSAYSQPEVWQLLSQVTIYLNKTFPNIPVYPLTGNHDVWPANQQPDSSDEYYTDFLDKTGWSHFLNKSEAVSFKQGI